jgi:hypothetical protein
LRESNDGNSVLRRDNSVPSAEIIGSDEFFPGATPKRLHYTLRCSRVAASKCAPTNPDSRCGSASLRPSLHPGWSALKTILCVNLHLRNRTSIGSIQYSVSNPDQGTNRLRIKTASGLS